MKGLLIKDLKIMMNQKKILFMMLLISIVISFSSHNPSFILGYLTFFISLIALNTINYDEYDNGYAFLFTLPFSKEEYIKEKYIITYLTAFLSCIFSFILTIIMSFMIDNHCDVMERCIEGIITLMIFIIILSILLPLKLKAGVEKSHMIQSFLFGILFIGIIGTKFILVLFNIDLSHLFFFIQGIDISIIILFLIIFMLLTAILSFCISKKIIHKKEF